MSESAAIITYIGFGLTILSAAGLTWSLWSNHNSKDEYSRRLDGIRDVVDSNKAALENLQEAHPKTRSQATRDRRYRSESGGRAGTQQFIGTMSLLHRRSLSLDLSTLAKLYSHMEDDGASEPAKTPTSAGAGQRLGPKANTDAINAGLRALDRPGAPCRK